MAKIPGRPKKAVRQEKFLGCFVTQTQNFIIEQKAIQAGVNKSDYLRQVAIFGQVKTRWKPEERELFKKMVGMSNDMHQLVKIAREEGALSAILHFEKYRNLIDDVINRLSHDQ